ncbi:hypothetical protein CDAR_238861 [Caerostris darwini]|uniref:Uncharacterized protein n=1 Tax=Caerostris darwini TaxID=1538125 RepID=A0AAV4PS78_9ARAC|nr:hypothetical protein CDAR_238861 [Caerostris darwini]
MALCGYLLHTSREKPPPLRITPHIKQGRRKQSPIGREVHPTFSDKQAHPHNNTHRLKQKIKIRFLFYLFTKQPSNHQMPQHASSDEHSTDHHPTTTKRTPTGNRVPEKKTGHGSEREHGGVFTAARPWLDCRISVARSPSSPLRR